MKERLEKREIMKDRRKKMKEEKIGQSRVGEKEDNTEKTEKIKRD